MFLTMMVIGVVGLAVMVVLGGPRHPPPSKLVPAAAGHGGRRTIPPPRLVFSVLALYGAFGIALLQGDHVSVAWAAVLAIGPALLVERILIRPLWILLFRFRAGARRST